MRELVYLSERKLRQFDLGRRGWRMNVTGEVRVPGVGGVSMTKDSAGPAVPDLDQVVAALEESDRASRWFTEEVKPGEWVRFEAPMAYTITNRGGVLFLDLDRRTGAYPTGGSIRLMLHGSSRHLVGGGPPSRQITDRDIDERMGFSAGNPHHLLGELMMDLRSADDPAGQSATMAIKRVEHKLPNRYSDVLNILTDELALPGTAAWLAGLARISAVPPSVGDHRIVVASPLYVEYVSAPDLDS